MSPPVSTAELYANQKELSVEVKNLKAEVAEMKSDIHEIKTDIKHISTDLWKVKIKISSYAAGAGVLTGVLLKLLDHIWKT